MNELRTADERNITAALVDLPDYHDAISNADPDIRLPRNVVTHLAKSPAGPYVKYRIATDDELADALKTASPQQKIAIISELHDNVLDVLVARSKPTDQSANSPVVSKPSTPSVQQRKAPPQKAPPVVKKGTTKNLLGLDGDDYVKARLAAKYNR